MTKKLTLFLAVVILCGMSLFAYLSQAMAGAENVTPITTPELQAKMADPKSFFLLDVREPSEFQSAHIQGATLIPLGSLAARLNEIPKDKPIVVYCRSGARSARGAALLQSNGFTNVFNLTGGINAWTDKCQNDKTYC